MSEIPVDLCYCQSALQDPNKTTVNYKGGSRYKKMALEGGPG
mgnify:CR=1 FL=1